MALEYSIRALEPEDAVQYHEITRMVGWSMTEGHHRDVIKAYSGYVWGAVTPDGKLISACVGMPMGEGVGFIGVFVTHPDFRKRGIGRKVWLKCMEVLGDGSNIFITAVSNMVPVYKKWGFSTPTAHGIMEVRGVPTLPANYQPPDGLTFHDISEANFEAVMDFDKTISLTDRADAMKVFFHSEHTKTLKCAMDIETKRVVGYVMLREGQKGLRMSSFYANSTEIATGLLYNALQHVEPESYIEVGFSVANLEQSKSVYRVFGLEGFERGDIGLCTKEDVDFPWAKVFGVLEYFALFY